jgi:hypothetical protein
MALLIVVMPIANPVVKPTIKLAIIFLLFMCFSLVKNVKSKK